MKSLDSFMTKGQFKGWQEAPFGGFLELCVIVYSPWTPLHPQQGFVRYLKRGSIPLTNWFDSDGARCNIISCNDEVGWVRKS